MDKWQSALTKGIPLEMINFVKMDSLPAAQKSSVNFKLENIKKWLIRLEIPRNTILKTSRKYNCIYKKSNYKGKRKLKIILILIKVIKVRSTLMTFPLFHNTSTKASPKINCNLSATQNPHNKSIKELKNQPKWPLMTFPLFFKANLIRTIIVSLVFECCDANILSFELK